MNGLYIGLMSGTSADGIDAALVEIIDGQPRFLGGHFQAHPEMLRQRLLAMAHCDNTSLEALYDLDADVGLALAEASLQLLKQHSLSPSDITAIGSHGHTIRHRPDAPHRFTAQIGDPNRIIQRCAIRVIADFRRRDVAAGGQGAPLAPAMHAICLSHPEEHRAILNLGGIANLTLLPSDAPSQALGFDTGPANCLLDAWHERHRGQRLDHEGQWAASGAINPALLQQLLADGYFARPAPKSTGREHFSLAWLDEHLSTHASLLAEDVQATLLALTARSVSDALERHAPECQRLLVCGGGVHNDYLMQQLQAQQPRMRVQSTAAVGWDPDWIEAICFAWLASRTLAGLAGNLPAVTGADAPVVLGAIHPA